MNLQSHTPISWYKLSLVSTGIILILNAGANLISTNFKAKYLAIIFDWEYLPFEIGLEGVNIFLCAVGTFLFTRKLPDFSFRTVLIRMILFSFLYLLLCLVYQLITYLIFIISDLDPKIISSKIWNFKFFNTGMRYSFVFMMVWMVLKYRQRQTENE